jgi:hypothetical protein
MSAIIDIKTCKPFILNNKVYGETQAWVWANESLYIEMLKENGQDPLKIKSYSISSHYQSVLDAYILTISYVSIDEYLKEGNERIYK